MNRLNPLAEQYVKLTLALGQHDSNLVDAFYGPAEWREKAASEPRRPLDALEADLRVLASALGEIHVPAGEAMLRLRHEYLVKQTSALRARASMLRGAKLSFDEESKALYDAVAPHHPDSYFLDLQRELDAELPGPEPLAQRIDAFRNRFIVPPDRVDTVFRTAIEECRTRTLRYLELPEGEEFSVEYVHDKSWSAYNWYQGGYRSVIQVNLDLPIAVDRMIDLACHEGYPGHHVYNALLEHHMVRDRGWVEFTVYPLFSPQSLIAEGTGNYGIEVAFPGNERVEYETGVLFPLAGLDSTEAPRYYRVLGLMARLDAAQREAARRYLDGELDAGDTVTWLVTHGLSSPERARQRIRFYDEYRSYIINYSFGQDLVRDHVIREAGPNPSREAIWKAFRDLISSPRLPSGLR